MKKLLLILIVLFAKPVLPQYQDSIYTVEIVTSFSPVISFFGYPRYPGAPDDAAYGYCGTIRAMWFPGRMLSVGIMSGYTYLVGEEIPSLKNLEQSFVPSARLVSIPLQVVVSMQNYNAEMGIGMGPYLLMSTINYGSPASGKRMELGLTLFGSYVFRVNDNICIGPEFRVLYLSYRRILSLMPTLSIHLEAYRY